MRRQSYVVGCDACEPLDISHARYGVDIGYDDFLTFECGCRFGFFSVDYDDESVVVGVDLVEGLLVVDELEGLRPIEFVPVAHTLNLNKISYSISSPELPQHPYIPSYLFELKNNAREVIRAELLGNNIKAGMMWMVTG